MSVRAEGTVVDGDINFSSPTMTGTDFRANFTFPNGTVAPIDGATLENGVLQNQTFEIETIGGNVAFAAQTVSSDDVILTGGSSLTTAGAIVPATATPLTGGTLNGTIRIVLPVTNVGGTVAIGAAIITQGAITKISNETTQGYDVALTSGVALITGGNVLQDPEDGAVMSLAVSFTGVAGDITSSTTTNIATPVNVTGLKIEGLQLRVMYVISPLNVSGLSLANDIATVTVRSMVFADQERYRPDQNSWEFGAPGSTIFNHGQVGLPNGDQFYYGGRTCTSVVNCAAGTFTATNERSAYINLNHEVVSWQTTSGVLSAARSNLTLTQLPDGRALAAGGANASTTLDASEAFDPVNRVWVPTTKMKRSRSHHTATLLPNGNVLVAGGFTALGNSTGTTSHAEIFYPPSNAWVHTAPMLSSRAFHAAVLLPEGNPMFMGGFSNGAYLSTTEVFYSTSHRWYQGPAMLEPRGQFTATVMHDGRIMVVGGLNAANGVLSTTRFFDPTTLAWSAGGALNFARHSHTATLLRDGRVIVIGGNDGANEIALAEIYNPATDAWSRVTTLGGNDLSIPRQNHTAALLPDGKIMIVGGFTALGGAITFNEGFDVDFSSFQMQGQFQQTGKRGDHATILLPDGNLLTAGGFDGLNYLSDTSFMYHGSFPDSQTLAGGLLRRPRVDASRPAIIAPDAPVTVVGANFRGVTEASGGGSASQNSSHAHPRVYMNRVEAASSSGNDSGWMVDLTSGMYHSGVNAWANMNSSLTFRVPETARKLPYGWYHLRVAANNQFSISSMVLVGPQLPTGTPGIPVGTAVGASSVSWTWTAAAGTFDGYSVYSATNGVFIATVAKSGGANETFLQRDLGPDTSTLIRIAAYNLSGDGSFAASTVPVLTAISNVNGLVGLAQDSRSIFWSWDPVAGALSYDVYSSSAGGRIDSPVGANYTQTGLSTNTVSSVRVLAVMPGGVGALSESATTFTLAASPVAGSPGINNVSTGSVSAQWLPNSNPADTRYHVQVLVGIQTIPVDVSSLTGLTAGLTTLEPNTKYTVSVAAINGDGRFTGFTTLGSTYTLARPPLNPRILASDPSGIAIAWDANSNPGTTPYQVLFSSDNFTTATISTHIAFAAGVTTTSTNVGSLITGKTYVFRISARNAFGQETSAASTQAFTDNGGGPAGSLSLLAPTTVYMSLAGTLGSARRFEIRIPERTFDVDTRVFISSRAVGVGGVNCGNIGAAFSITNLPAVQPRLPVEVGIQYVPGETGLGAVTTLGMARFDPVSGACVPMESRVDTTNNIVYA
ncbi:MAG: fibronectin type III domain-containing protein, partial [Elusimicrobia bacterium]